MGYFQDHQDGSHFMRGGQSWISNQLRLEEEFRKRHSQKFDFDDLDALEEEKTLEETEELSQ
ncbi:MAG: hypothetical protein IKY15_00385 [Clostridia bacterium]|nr:hypothetical protein [Clostridia bacterium]